MNNINHLVFSILFIVIFSSCSENKSVDVSDVVVESELIRFDSLFYNSDKNTFFELQKKYPRMLSSETPDSIWLNKIEDNYELELFDKSKKVFGNFKGEYVNILNVLKRVKYFYPDFKSPDIYTIISGLDFKYPVLYSEGRLFVSLDLYLGLDESEYKVFPKYLVKNMTPERLKVDVADAISKTIIEVDNYNRSLLSQMIYHGKLLYMAQQLLPEQGDSLIIGYTQKEIIWCSNNEKDIWTYMVKKKYIYSNDDRLLPRFIDVAPFSKFYLELDQKSPGRVGRWLGWQIVKSYMKNNDVTLQELMKDEDAKSIFIKSRYKPSK